MGGRATQRGRDLLYVKVLEEENMEIISTILGCEMLASVKYAQYLLEGHSQKRYFCGNCWIGKKYNSAWLIQVPNIVNSGLDLGTWWFYDLP